MTGVITFLCCSDTRRYVTAAGSICPVALAPCSQWQMLFARDNAVTARRRTRNSDNEMRFCDCERVRDSSNPRYSVCSDVIIAHGQHDFHSERSMGWSKNSGMTRKTIFSESRYIWFIYKLRFCHLNLYINNFIFVSHKFHINFIKNDEYIMY